MKNEGIEGLKIELWLSAPGGICILSLQVVNYVSTAHLHALQLFHYSNALPTVVLQTIQGHIPYSRRWSQLVFIRLSRALNGKQCLHHILWSSDDIATLLQRRAEQRPSMSPPPLSLFTFFGHTNWLRNFRLYSYSCSLFMDELPHSLFY